MSESYSRQHHEELMGELEAHTTTLEELESQADELTPEDHAYIEELRKEKQQLEEVNREMFDRAWDEAIQHNVLSGVTDEDRREYARTNEEWKSEQEHAYHDATERFRQLMVRSEDALDGYYNIDVTCESKLPGIATTNLRYWTDNSQGFFDVTFTYPKLKSDEDVGQRNYEHTECTLVVTKDGELITGWEQAPLALHAHERGKAAILDEIERIFEEVGYVDIPVYQVDYDLVTVGGRKGGETTDVRKPGVTIAGVDTSFAATERFKILRDYDPLFMCEKAYHHRGVDTPRYSAFVYHDFVIFDSLRYGNAIYFLEVKPPVNVEEERDLRSIDRTVRQQAMDAFTKRVHFKEEVRKPRSDRRAAGNKFPTPHPERPDNLDGDHREAHAYRRELAQYYASLFDHVRNALQGVPDDN